MKLNPITVTDKTGKNIVLRSAQESDADNLIRYMKKTAEETLYLIRESEEVTITYEREVSFIQNMENSERGLMLIATIDGNHIGNCSLSETGSFMRYKHRCSIAIALYKEYWGRGIGEIMMRTVLEEARKAGFEQAELEVISENKGAISLYKKLGFETHGHLPRNMKYSDGTYADAEWMVKML